MVDLEKTFTLCVLPRVSNWRVKDISFVEPDFNTVPPKKTFEISSSFCHFDTWNESISFVRKQIRCKQLQECD